MSIWEKCSLEATNDQLPKLEISKNHFKGTPKKSTVKSQMANMTDFMFTDLRDENGEPLVSQNDAIRNTSRAGISESLTFKHHAASASLKFTEICEE